MEILFYLLTSFVPLTLAHPLFPSSLSKSFLTPPPPGFIPTHARNFIPTNPIIPVCSDPVPSASGATGRIFLAAKEACDTLLFRGIISSHLILADPGSLIVALYNSLVVRL